MNQPKQRYPINQCALYKCRSRKRLETLLSIEPGDLKNIHCAIKYHAFEIEKKNSDEKRKITAPDKVLKDVQRRVLTLLQWVERPSWLISGEKGKSYIDNGKAHLSSNYMLAIDIKKFYDNCRRNYVYLFFRDKMQTTPDVAAILTDIVTFGDGIPTGCPTSQLIAYYAYEDMFKLISDCALTYSCQFTLYVDDMTFSSDIPFDHQKLGREIDIILRRFGHKPKYRKLKYYSKEDAKPITGTIVTPEHRLDVPNILQKKVYDNFQLAKQLEADGASEELLHVTQALSGQIQASRNIDDNRFPEILRLSQNMRGKVKAEKENHKPALRRRQKKKIRILKHE